MEQIVTFLLDEKVYALPLNNVKRIIHAVEIRTFPNAPQIVSGIINVMGQIIPVIDVRSRFGSVSKQLDPNDQFIIANTGKRVVALWTDEVTGIKTIDSDSYVEANDVIPDAQHIKGIVKMEDHIVLICNLEQFLSLEEEDQLNQLLLKRNRV